MIRSFIKLKENFMRGNTVLRKWLLSYLVILMIPLIGSLIIYFTTHGMIKQEIIDSNAGALDTFQALIDSRVEQASKLATSIMIDERYSAMMQKSSGPQSIVERQRVLVKFLSNYTASASVDEVLVYVPAMDYCITNNTASSMDRLYDALVHFKNCDTPIDSWRESLVLPPGESKLIYSSLSSYSNFGAEALVYCSGSIPTLYSTYYDSSIFISIKLNDIMEQVTPREGASLHIVGQGVILKSFGQNLSGLELPNLSQRYGRLAFEGDEYVYMTKSSDVSGFSYAMLMPQSSFWLKNTLINTILIIGFSVVAVFGILALLLLLNRNYRPVENALSALRDVVAAPGENEFDIIAGKLSDLYDVNDFYQSSISQQQSYLRENHLQQMLAGNHSPLADENITESLQIDFGSGVIAPVVVFIHGILKSDDTTKGLHGSTIAFVIDNILRELIDGEFIYHKTTDGGRVVFLFSVDAQDMDYFEECIGPWLKHMCAFCQERLELHMRCVRGPFVEHMEDLASVYREINTAYQYQFAATDDPVCVMKNSDVSAKLLRYVQHSALIFDSVAMKAKSDAVMVAERLFGDMAQSGLPFQTIKFYIIALASRLLPLADMGNAPFNRCADELLLCDSVTELRKNFILLLEILCDDGAIDRPQDKVATSVQRYVEENFADMNLSLTQISQSIGLSAKYISKLYHMETGERLLDYINSVRIAKAKNLMREKRAPLSDISQAVGYSNVKTFRRAFHKIEGVNPSEFM